VSYEELTDLDDDLESLYVRRVLSQNAEDVDRVLSRIEQHVASWRAHEARRDAFAQLSAADPYELACLRQEKERADGQRRAERIARMMDAPALGAYRSR
jgi:hypothetical protein